MRKKLNVLPSEIFPLLLKTNIDLLKTNRGPLKATLKWKEIREKGFANEVFPTLEYVIDRLCETVNNLTKEVVKSICARKWLRG